MVFDSAKLQCKSSSLLPYLIDSFAYIISIASNNPIFKIRIVWRFIFSLRRKKLNRIMGPFVFHCCYVISRDGGESPFRESDFKKNHIFETKALTNLIFSISWFFELVHFSSCLGVWPFFSPEINSFQGVLKTTRHDTTRHDPTRTEPTRPDPTRPDPPDFPRKNSAVFL